MNFTKTYIPVTKTLTTNKRIKKSGVPNSCFILVFQRYEKILLLDQRFV